MLTLVPARGGSKRIPRKNLRMLGGRPLLLWTLERFRYLNPVVSSEDDEILHLAKSKGFGAIVRPDPLATDEASSVDVAIHAMQQTDEDSVLLLQPTSPFRNIATVTRALLRFQQTWARPVVAMKNAPHVFIGSAPIHGAHIPTGSCYVTSIESLQEHRSFMPKDFDPLYEEGLGTLDIDTEADWQIAEAIARSWSNIAEAA